MTDSIVDSAVAAGVATAETDVKTDVAAAVADVKAETSAAVADAHSDLTTFGEKLETFFGEIPADLKADLAAVKAKLAALF